MEQQATFEGWAVVELFGHSREIGYVKTEYFGRTGKKLGRPVGSKNKKPEVQQWKPEVQQ
jgi:hypothetical protein